MEKIIEYTEKIRQAALKAENEVLLQLIEERNLYFEQSEAAGKLEKLTYIQKKDEELRKEIEQITAEVENYSIMQVSKKRATQKYNEY